VKGQGHQVKFLGEGIRHTLCCPCLKIAIDFLQIKDVDSSVHKDVMERRTDGSVSISLRNFVGEGIIKYGYVSAC
jgi:hypothetical protein